MSHYLYVLLFLRGECSFFPRLCFFEHERPRITVPLRPLGHQAAHYGAHLSPSLRVSAHHQTHLDSIPSLIIFPTCHSLWFLPQASLFLFHVCVLFVVLSLSYDLFILLQHSLLELASRLSAHIVTITDVFIHLLGVIFDPSYCYNCPMHVLFGLKSIL